MQKAISIILALSLMSSLLGCSSTTGSSAINTPASPSSQSTQSQTAAPELNANETVGQKNARESAINYLSFSPFSHDGLVKQLEFEKYSTEEATYGADNCGADWNEQALQAAKNYLDTSAFSYSGLVKQLEFEKYTTEQATYGVDNCGADWNEQAAKSAKSYLEISSFSRQALIDQLTFEGFTSEQAEYGATANGY